MYYNGDSFKPPMLLQEFDVKETMEFFGVKEGEDTLFPLWELSRPLDLLVEDRISN